MFLKVENAKDESGLADRLRARLAMAQQREARRQTRKEIPQRVFMFSRSEAVCPHSRGVSQDGCETLERRRRRRPASEVPEQPCLYALAQEQD